MKKLLTLVVAVALIGFALPASAQEYVEGGFVMSGHINTGFGFDYHDKNAGGANAPNAGLNREFANFAYGVKTQDFGFLLYDAEVDISKEFGENIRARLDLDFWDGSIGGVGLNAVEQAYVTANIGIGNGIELAVGRMEAPMGFEAIDRNENNTITHSMIYNYNLRPRTLTAMKFYYAFSDMVDLHFWLANNMMDTMQNFNVENTLIPTTGFRLGLSFGDDDAPSTVGLSVAGGPEANRAGKKTGRWSYLSDLDWNIWVTESFAIGGEGIFRINNAVSGATDTKIFGGLLDLHYVFSDVWDGTLKYALIRPNNGFGTVDANAHPGLTVTKGYLHEIGLAGGYTIADGAKFMAEYRFDWTKYTGLNKTFSHSLLGNFAYEF